MWDHELDEELMILTKAYLISSANPLTFLPRATENFLGMTTRGLEA